jgi:hypothetical protein
MPKLVHVAVAVLGRQVQRIEARRLQQPEATERRLPAGSSVVGAGQ